MAEPVCTFPPATTELDRLAFAFWARLSPQERARPDMAPLHALERLRRRDAALAERPSPIAAASEPAEARDNVTARVAPQAEPEVGDAEPAVEVGMGPRSEAPSPIEVVTGAPPLACPSGDGSGGDAQVVTSRVVTPTQPTAHGSGDTPAALEVVTGSGGDRARKGDGLAKRMSRWLSASGDGHRALGVSTREALGALGVELERGHEMVAGKAVQALGWRRVQRRVSGRREWRYFPSGELEVRP